MEASRRRLLMPLQIIMGNNGRLREPVLCGVVQPVVIGRMVGNDFDLDSLCPVEVVILNKRDFEAAVFRPGYGQNEEHQDESAALDLIEFIAGDVEVGEVVVGRADFG